MHNVPMVWEFLTAVFSSWAEKVGIVLTILPFVEKIPFIRRRLKDTPILERYVPLLWVIGVIFVFYGFYSAWTDEHEAVTKRDVTISDMTTNVTRLEKQIDDLAKPDFRPVFYYSPSVARPFKFPNDTFVTIMLRLENLGAPSITQGWKLEVTLADGSVHQGRKVIPSFGSMNYSADDHKRDAEMIFHSTDDIEEKTSETAVERGAAKSGAIFFELKDVNYLIPRQKGTKFTLSFHDITGRTYEQTYTMVGGPKLDEPIYVPGLPTHKR